MTEAKKVFCSYRTLDAEVVHTFAARLRRDGIDAWLDTFEISPGQDFVAAINAGLTASEVGLIFISKQWDARAWMALEASALLCLEQEDGKPLLLITLDEETQIPPLFRPKSRFRIDDYDRIRDAITGRLAKPPLGVRRGLEVRRLAFELEALSAQKIRVRAELDGVELAPPHEASIEIAELSRSLFAGTIGQRLEELLRALSPSQHLEVSYAHAPGPLFRLPLESAVAPNGVELALQEGVSVVRRSIGVVAGAFEAAPGPLKILVAIGAPDEGQTRLSPLDFERELGTILDAIDRAGRPGDVEVKILEVSHPEELGRALREDAFHVLHLSARESCGALVLEDEDGGAVALEASSLSKLIIDSGRPLPLIVLSACDETGSAPRFAEALAAAPGVSQLLVLPPIVADGEPNALLARFYGALAKDVAPRASRVLAIAQREVERARPKRLGSRAILFVAAEEEPLVDPALDPCPLAAPAVRRMPGPVRLLSLGELIGRRAVVRDVLRWLRDSSGASAGVVLTGMGGVGKSAVAGRCMARMREEGWAVAAVRDRASIRDIALAIAAAIEGAELAGAAARLRSDDLDDDARLRLITSLLETEKLLLVLDNFEAHLEPDGRAWRDEVSPAWVSALVRGCGRGKILATSRHPLPGLNVHLEMIPIGPLSVAEIRKLLRRLEGFKHAGPDVLTTIVRSIGGHPRMIEYVDGLLRGGAARFPAVREKLEACAAAAGVAIEGSAGDLDSAVLQGPLIGAQDILLDALLAVVDEHGDRETLLQVAVCEIPIELEGLAWALAGATPSPAEVAAVRTRAARLTALSLLTPVGEKPAMMFMHRWTAQTLAARFPLEAAHRRAGEYRVARIRGSSSFDDGHEAIRRFLDAAAFDRATHVAVGYFEARMRYGHATIVAELGREMLARLPVRTPHYAVVIDAGLKALIALGQTASIGDEYEKLIAGQEALIVSSPGDLELQQNLGVLHMQFGDLLCATGKIEEAKSRYEKGRVMAQSLIERVDRPEYRRNLAISYERLANLERLLGHGSRALELSRRALEIHESIAETSLESRKQLSVAKIKLSNHYEELGQLEPALELSESAHHIVSELDPVALQRVDVFRLWSVTSMTLGQLLKKLGKLRDSALHYDRALQIMNALHGNEPERTDYRRDLAVIHDRLSDLAWSFELLDEALRHRKKAVDHAAWLAERDPIPTAHRRDLAGMSGKYANLLFSLDREQEANSYFNRALQLFEQLIREEPGRVDDRRNLALCLEQYAAWAVDDGPERRNAARRALTYRQEVHDLSPDVPELRLDLAGTLILSGHLDNAMTPALYAQVTSLLDFPDPLGVFTARRRSILDDLARAEAQGVVNNRA